MLVKYGKDGCQPRKEDTQGGHECELYQSECCGFREGVENGFRGGVRQGTRQIPNNAKNLPHISMESLCWRRERQTINLGETGAFNASEIS
jgi:hypothetical protein